MNCIALYYYKTNCCLSLYFSKENKFKMQASLLPTAERSSALCLHWSFIFFLSKWGYCLEHGIPKLLKWSKHMNYSHKKQANDVCEAMACSLMIAVHLRASYIQLISSNTHINPNPPFYLSTPSWNTYAIYRGFRQPTPSDVDLFCLCTEHSEVWDSPSITNIYMQSRSALVSRAEGECSKTHCKIIRVVLKGAGGTVNENGY